MDNDDRRPTDKHDALGRQVRIGDLVVASASYKTELYYGRVVGETTKNLKLRELAQVDLKTWKPRPFELWPGGPRVDACVYQEGVDLKCGRSIHVCSNIDKAFLERIYVPEWLMPELIEAMGKDSRECGAVVDGRLVLRRDLH